MTVKFNSFSGDIITSINDIIVFKANDKSLKGNQIGITSFTLIILTFIFQNRWYG